MTAEEIFKQLSGAAAGLPHDKVLSFQLLHRQRSSAGKGMPPAAGKHQHIVDQRDGYQVRMPDSAFDHPYIQLHIQELFLNDPGIVYIRIQNRVRTGFFQIPDKIREQAAAYRDGSPHPQTLEPGFLRHILFNQVKLCRNWLGVAVQAFSCLCDKELFGQALKE